MCTFCMCASYFCCCGIVRGTHAIDAFRLPQGFSTVHRRFKNRSGTEVSWFPSDLAIPGRTVIQALTLATANLNGHHLNSASLARLSMGTSTQVPYSPPSRLRISAVQSRCNLHIRIPSFLPLSRFTFDRTDDLTTRRLQRSCAALQFRETGTQSRHICQHIRRTPACPSLTGSDPLQPRFGP